MTENNHFRILILDDDVELGELLSEYLQTTNQCDVFYTNHTDNFWTLLTQDDFDVLFLDYKLGETNGLEILSQMCSRGIDIPTVMMTGEGNENIAARAIQYGALDYLVKGEYSFSALPPLIQKAVKLKQMQKDMQQYLDKIRYQAALLNNMRDAVVVWDINGTITYWNNAAEKVFGVPSSDKVGKSIKEAYFSHFEPPILDLPQSDTNNIQIEHRYRSNDGQIIWISSHISPLINNENQDLFGFMDVARDITPSKHEQEVLIQSQNFIQRILDTSPNIIFIYNLVSAKIRYINPEIKPILGYEVEECQNINFKEIIPLIHPDDLLAVRSQIQLFNQLQEGEVCEFTYRFLDRNGTWHWLTSRVTLFTKGEREQPIEIIGVIQDVTVNIEAQNKLQLRLESERILATISNYFLNLSPHDTNQGISYALLKVGRFLDLNFGIILIIDDNQLTPYQMTYHETHPGFNCGIAEGNSNLLRLHWLGKKFSHHDILVINHPGELPDDAEGEKKLISKLGTSLSIFVPLYVNKQLNGIMIFGSDHQGEAWNKEHVYILQSFKDMITNIIVQKQVDLALERSEARYRAIVEDHQTEMICRFLPDTTLTFVNEAYCNYFKLERNQLIGKSFINPIYQDDLEKVKLVLSELNKDNPIVVFEHLLNFDRQPPRWQEWTCRVIIDQQNDFPEYQAIGRDITQRKEMEQQIKLAQTRLTQATRLASIGELASGVAHQISNPLTTIIADAQILLHTLSKDHPGRESAEAIKQAGWRIQQVIHELMKFSQPSKPYHEPIEINETIEHALLLTDAHLKASGFKVSLDLAQNMPKITGNARQLTDLWVTLLLLARSASEEGGHHVIRIRSFQRNEKSIQVDVSDNGIPIPPEKVDNIFEPQLIPTGSGRGTGMELSICREIARQHKGEISICVDSNETTFQIVFFN